MNLAALETFLAVVDAGNLNKAAERLNVTQSTVTARLDALDDALDDALGQKLLVRSRKGAQLTKAGFAFQRHAELIVRTWEQGQKAVGLPKGFSGLLSLACQPDVWEGAGEAWVADVQSARPELAIEVWPGEMSDINRWLASGLVDAAFTLQPVTAGGTSARTLMSDRLVQVSTEAREARAWDDAYIYVDLGPDFRRQHSLAWPGDDTAHMTFGSSSWALAYLLGKGGSAYLPWRLAEQHVKAGRLHPVRGAAEFSRTLQFSWRQDSLTSHPWLAEDGNR